MIMRRFLWPVVGVLVLALVAFGITALTGGGYQLKLLMPSAGKVFVGGKVLLRGEQIGDVADLGVQGNKALVTIDIDDDYAPLHAGTTARITWSSVIGAQAVDLMPGPASNPELPSGRMITGNTESVQLDDLLAALDRPTRAHVQGLVADLRATLRGREPGVRSTISTAGPAVQAAGQVLKAVGQDGPSIRQLVVQVRGMIQQLSDRDGQLAGVVNNVGDLTSVAAPQQEQLKRTLAALPSTVQQANHTLGRIPQTVDNTTPLLTDLRPATSKLAAVSGNLSPVLTKLRPAVAQLRPTLGAANQLLGRTPQLLDTAHGMLPDLNRTLTNAAPAVSFLRPYTPEFAGWLSTWVSTFGSVANNGRHTARALITGSGSSFTDNPGLLPPGMQQQSRPAPGRLVDEPWTDANGDGLR
jgi:phospholipid/cholesterol/gamma-HCH transport system substrate-binding protein